MNRVSLRHLAGYRRQEVRSALEELLAPLGGMEAFVSPGQKVLLKPNMLAGKAPEKAVTTHPEIVRAAIDLVRRAGGVVSVGDSPGLGNPRQVASKCGILQVIEETQARFAPFAESVPVRIEGGTFHQLELARDILEADVVINLPKLKTHQMMGLTCAVKNLFGAVVGMRKPQLHLQAGTDKAFFARMLLDLADRVAPALTIVDGITGMEGNGPGNGDPVALGLLLAGRDPVAVDTVAAHLLGLDERAVWTWRVARKTGRAGSRLQDVDLVGPPLETLRPARFRPARQTDVNFGLPPWLKKRLKRSLTAFPAIDHQRCVRCGHCVRHCPPGAMALTGQVVIDLDRCIRCFCCQELCPHAAIDTCQGRLLRMAERWRKNRR
ncbi:uncharacterized protein (DUF362 family) [Geothermobacter ehrlichii]|uniref:Uncharacterized protein (DUF362 family) n=1 Tax=Geothermobacter ehrlichii TaxID=213224 RepID=A0A5D3WHL8_9BACT|nr:DUF362 domain-containing protein [Geothermobacter ehrlichii]TYO98286.1 uncharacterized protein (DUF362 family) [Geothermobacter ehrlichii]